MAVYATREKYGGNRLYTFYPSRTPIVNSTDYMAFNLTSSIEYAAGGEGRSALQQAGWQLAALALTLFAALVGGKFTGFIMRLPFFDVIDTESDDLFDDKSAWLLPKSFRLSSKGKYKILPRQDRNIKNDLNSRRSFEI